jgi:hypothetical protein
MEAIGARYEPELLVAAELSPGAPGFNSTAWLVARWLSSVDSNHANWREDVRYRQCNNGAMYYLGGESGQFIRVTQDGAYLGGQYDGAKSGIENAVLTYSFTYKLGSYEAALSLAVKLCGERFSRDIYDEVTQFASEVNSQCVSDGFASERSGAKPSTLKQLRDAKAVPKPPRKSKIQSIRENKVEL